MSRKKRRRGGRRGSNPYQGDRFTKKAKKEGYSARSVYKLSEIQKRFRILRRGDRVIDLGCSPGSWSRYVLEEIEASKLVGVDIKAPEFDGVTFLKRSVLRVSAADLREAMDGQADVLLSDMAPLTTGIALKDHVAQLELARKARDLALKILAPGGHFVVKVFDGEDAHDFTMSLRPYFRKVKRVRPEAVRKVSREFYLVCLDFSPADDG